MYQLNRKQRADAGKSRGSNARTASLQAKLLKEAISTQTEKAMRFHCLNTGSLATAANLSYNTVQAVLEGLRLPTKTTVLALAAALRCSSDWLCTPHAKLNDQGGPVPFPIADASEELHAEADATPSPALDPYGSEGVLQQQEGAASASPRIRTRSKDEWQLTRDVMNLAHNIVPDTERLPVHSPQEWVIIEKGNAEWVAAQFHRKGTAGGRPPQSPTQAARKQQLAYRLRLILRARNLKQSWLAVAARLGDASLYSILKGNVWPQPHTARKLAAALGISEAQLKGEAPMSAADYLGWEAAVRLREAAQARNGLPSQLHLHLSSGDEAATATASPSSPSNPNPYLDPYDEEINRDN
jgi:transcriptional regulator with XRE-family HTH domain